MPKILANDFVKINSAASLLGCSVSTLRRRIKEGDFQEGIHWCDRASVNAKRPTLYVNVPKVQELWSIPVANR